MMVQNLLTLKFLLIDERETNRKMSKNFATRNLQQTQKKLYALI